MKNEQLVKKQTNENKPLPVSSLYKALYIYTGVVSAQEQGFMQTSHRPLFGVSSAIRSDFFIDFSSLL